MIQTPLEFQTDNAVQGERLKADQATSVARARADYRMKSERLRSDTALEEERSRADVAIDIEREKHSQTKISLTTRDEFLAIVSHDLRNPIGTASTCAAMLLENPEFKDLSSEARRWIELIKRNVDSSLRLIADLLDVERIAQGKLQLNLAVHTLEKIVRESLESFVPAASASRIRLQMPASEISSKVSCDRDRIAQVLSNLIGNAIKFTPPGGEITLGVSATESEIQVSVHDTGPGIPQENRARIFERFAQLGLNDRKGLGLGLYISKMLIEGHGGRIWAESKLGEGSCFRFALARA